MPHHPILPDTRPYPELPVKNNLLLHAARLADPATGSAQRKLSQETLFAEISRMLAQNFYLELSVALNMVQNDAQYRILTDVLAQALNAQNDTEVQWFALPVVAVAGCNSDIAVPSEIPLAALKKCLAAHPHYAPLADAVWLPHFADSDTLGGIKPDRWFAAKQNTAAAEALAASLPRSLPVFAAGQSVSTFFALGYGSRAVQTALARPAAEAGLPLMQVFQSGLDTPGLTLFANPLPPDTPVAALMQGSHMRRRMALEVFAANAIRAVRLNSHRVGAVMAAQKNGRLLFGFNAADNAFEILPQTYCWPLAPDEDIAAIQRDFIELMLECRVENLFQLDGVLEADAALPAYARAVTLPGRNPLFAETLQ